MRNPLWGRRECGVRSPMTGRLEFIGVPYGLSRLIRRADTVAGAYCLIVPKLPAEFRYYRDGPQLLHIAFGDRALPRRWFGIRRFWWTAASHRRYLARRFSKVGSS